MTIDPSQNRQVLIDVYTEKRVFYFNLAMNICGNTHTAEDLVEDCFLKCLQHIKSFTSREHLEKLLNIMVRGHWNNIFNKESNRRKLLSAMEFEEYEEPFIDDMAVQNYIHTRLSLLLQDQQDIIKAFFFNQLSVKEISQLYDLTPARVLKIKNKALQLLRSRKQMMQFLDRKREENLTNEWVKQFQSGKDVHDIAAKAGLPAWEVRKRITHKLTRNKGCFKKRL